MPRGFFGHAGRPGQRGGSVAQDASFTMRDVNKIKKAEQEKYAKAHGITRKTLQNKESIARQKDKVDLEERARVEHDKAVMKNLRTPKGQRWLTAEATNIAEQHLEDQGGSRSEAIREAKRGIKSGDFSVKWPKWLERKR